MIAIIGGSGFIGTRLAMRLNNKGIPFIIIDKRESVKFPEYWKFADVRDIDALTGSLRGCTAAINLAAEHKDNVRPVSLYDEVNIGGAENLCIACERNNINKIIFTSSVAVYGFAPKNTDETGAFNPFNDYGRTKMEAEKVYRSWISKNESRSLTIIRPTVVFGERNRGNVYNLLKQIASGKFLMIGKGNNLKSMAYVENVAAFIEYSLDFKEGIHLFNYIDKPDMTMNELVSKVNECLGKKAASNIRVPYFIGYTGGKLFDFFSVIAGKEFPVSAIRIKKFCSDSQFNTINITKTGFKAPETLAAGLENTLVFEFKTKHKKDDVLFYTE